MATAIFPFIQGRGSHGANGANAPPTFKLWRQCLSLAPPTFVAQFCTQARLSYVCSLPVVSGPCATLTASGMSGLVQFTQRKSTVKPGRITVWTVVQTVLTATFNSYGDRQTSTPPQNRYPWTDWQKILHNWLRPRGGPLYKIWYKSSCGGFWANGWNITKIIFYLYLFLRLA